MANQVWWGLQMYFYNLALMGSNYRETSNVLLQLKKWQIKCDGGFKCTSTTKHWLDQNLGRLQMYFQNIKIAKRVWGRLQMCFYNLDMAGTYIRPWTWQIKFVSSRIITCNYKIFQAINNCNKLSIYCFLKKLKKK